MAIFPFFSRALVPLVLAAGLPFGAAEAAEYGRVGRVVDLHGDVALYDPQYNEWTEAVRNRPLAAGDRLVLQRSARAEVRVGSTVLMLGQGADLAIDALDDDRLFLTLNAGALALRVTGRDQAGSTEVRTPETRVRPQRGGLYRIDRDDESTFVAVWRGALEASGHGHLLLVGEGERYEIWVDGRTDAARSRIARMPEDRFAGWAQERFAALDAAPRSFAYASPDMTGVEDLDRYGRWAQHPEYGAVWIPVGVAAGWAPFTDGRWVWMQPWGWTWVDAQPWGFAPSHYGRWLQWQGRWCWWPGVRQARPVFAPAVVAWVGGSHFGVGISIGAQPPAAWVPLNPWQPYVPIAAPRPPRHGKPPPRWLPPPSEPISRDRGAGPVRSRPSPPAFTAPPPVTYGPQGVPSNVQTAPGSRGVQPVPPPAGGERHRPDDDDRPRRDDANRSPPNARAPLPDQRLGPGPEPGNAAPGAVKIAPFSAPPKSATAEPPRQPPDKRDTRADPRQRERVQ